MRGPSVSERRGYYTDTTDEQWALVEPMVAAWKARHPSVSGHHGRYPMREIHTQIEQMTARLGELDAERAELAVARKVILTVLTEADSPLRRKDLCHALDTGTEPARLEGMPAKLKRLVATGLVTEDTPGLFAIPSP